MDRRLTGTCGERGVFTCRARGGRGGRSVLSGRRGCAPSVSSAVRPRPRGRGTSSVRGGVSERAPAGRGGEPRAARPGEPRLRPVFLWARHHRGTVHEVRVEDYDYRNRIRIARTKNGWRVIPRTDIYNSIRLSPTPPTPDPPARKSHRRRRKKRAYKQVKRRPNSDKIIEHRPSWAPDLESHIPSHTIAIPRVPTPCEVIRTPPPEPTPLDNLLAVAELEFNQQQQQATSEQLQLDTTVQRHYSYLPDEEVAPDVMSFDLGEAPKTNGGEMYYQKVHVEQSEEEYQNSMGVHKDLFETISEAHYLPDLSGPHDEALLESLVEKGCEDNHIIGQALEKLVSFVNTGSNYVEEEVNMFPGGVPVSDIINRLEQLESPGRNSITAAQSLLHLHHIGDHLNVAEHQQSIDQTYINNDVYVPDNTTECNLETIDSTSNIQSKEINNIEYTIEPKERLANDLVTTNLEYVDKVPEKLNEFDENLDNDQNNLPLPDQSNIASSDSNKEDSAEENDHEENNLHNEEEPKLDVKEECITEFKKEEESNEDVVPTDLSCKRNNDDYQGLENTVATTDEEYLAKMNHVLADKIEELPKDFSGYRRLLTPHSNESPRRLEFPRAPSRESDAMQSPQPSGIPAVPPSPEHFSVPQTKNKHTLFLETLLSSPSPKMYTSEVTITKQQCEPLNLGKHRKSASPTVSSCSDEIRKFHKEFGEPHEKRSRSESTEELAKISKVFIPKTSDECVSESKSKRSEKNKNRDENSPLKQLHALKTSPDFNVPDPLLIPKNKLNDILAAPAREIPALLIQRPELRLPEAFAYPAVLQDPDILVIALTQLESIIENDTKIKLADKPSPIPKPTSTKPTESSQTKPATPSVDGLAEDIDAATSAALNQMIWLPYFSQIEAAMACSQNMDFLKALNSSGYPTNYADLSQMFANHPSRFMNPSGFSMMPPMDYDSRMQFAMWQEAMNAQRSKNPPEPTKETAKSSDVQSAYVHSTKSHQNKTHSSARTSPIVHNYNNCQRGSMPHNPFLQGMYPAMNPNLRQNMPLPGLQIPYFNQNMMNSQRSPRSSQQKSPTSPYYQNNNYLQSLKHDANHQRSNSSSSQESPRPRISVKSLQNLLEPAAAAASGSRRASSSSTGRRREEPEVGSTTPLGETPPQLPPHPHDPIHHLWHPLFGNQKGYNSPWSWTTVTAPVD